MGEVRDYAKQATHAALYGGRRGSAMLTANAGPELRWYLDNGAKVITDVESGDHAVYSIELPAVPAMEWELNK